MLANQSYRNRFAILFGINENEINDNNIVNSYTSFNNVHHELIRQNINQIISEDLNGIRNNLLNSFEDNHNSEDDIILQSFEDSNSPSNVDTEYLTRFIKSLKKTKIKKETQCNICFEDIQKNTSIYKLSCNHSYHINCIETWFKQNLSCPICRKQFKVE